MQKSTSRIDKNSPLKEQNQKKPINQSFSRNENLVYRKVAIGTQTFTSCVKSYKNHLSAEKDYFVSSLNEPVKYLVDSNSKRVSYIDLFCGGGGLSLGIHESLKYFGFNPKLILASDLDVKALNLVKSHFRPLYTMNNNIQDLVKFSIDHTGHADDFIFYPEFYEKKIRDLRGRVDILVGGPPCQGHSNLNNKTRRFDSRNDLYYLMPAFAIGLDIPVVIIENVEAIKHSYEDVVSISKKIFKTHNYFIYEKKITSEDYGVAQTRGRHFLIATKKPIKDFEAILEKLKVPPLTFDDINLNLPKLNFKNKELETLSDLSDENLARVEFLHNENLYNLPAKNRPTCHQEGHSYQSVYGRMYPDRPSGTITTGFASPGRGRYVHPHEKRSINAREAARIQSFPDHYWKSAPNLDFFLSQYRKIIGDAVPANMIFPIISALYSNLHEK